MHSSRTLAFFYCVCVNQKAIYGVLRSVAENRRPLASYGQVEEYVSRKYVSRGVEAILRNCIYTYDCASKTLRRYIFRGIPCPCANEAGIFLC
jgi:hypothetical protein